MGAQSEARRRLDEIGWSDEFLRYLHLVLPPQDFLAFWYETIRILLSNYSER